MADDARHSRDDLTDAVPSDWDFFALLRELETDRARFGRGGGADREPARLGQVPRLTFAVSDVAAIDRREDGVPEIGVNVIGLIGPEGPMPLHLTRWILSRLSNRWFSGEDGATADTAFLDLINVLQHRQIALFWRSWADARPEIHIAHGDGGRVTATMRALAGLGLPGTDSEDIRLDGAKLRHSTSLVQEARSPERLTQFLETVLQVPVALEEFIGNWIEIPENLQSRLGRRHAGLGAGAVIGKRSFDREGHAEIRIGPLSFAQLVEFIDDSDAWRRLCHALRFAAGLELQFDVRLELAAGEVPPARLGGARLGRTAWLAPDASQSSDDIVFRRVTDGDRLSA